MEPKKINERVLKTIQELVAEGTTREIIDGHVTLCYASQTLERLYHARGKQVPEALRTFKADETIAAAFSRITKEIGRTIQDTKDASDESLAGPGSPLFIEDTDSEGESEEDFWDIPESEKVNGSASQDCKDPEIIDTRSDGKYQGNLQGEIPLEKKPIPSKTLMMQKPKCQVPLKRPSIMQSLKDTLSVVGSGKEAKKTRWGAKADPKDILALKVKEEVPMDTTEAKQREPSELDVLTEKSLLDAGLEPISKVGLAEAKMLKKEEEKESKKVPDYTEPEKDSEAKSARTQEKKSPKKVPKKSAKGKEKPVEVPKLKGITVDASIAISAIDKVLGSETQDPVLSVPNEKKDFIVEQNAADGWKQAQFEKAGYPIAAQQATDTKISKFNLEIATSYLTVSHSYFPSDFARVTFHRNIDFGDMSRLRIVNSETDRAFMFLIPRCEMMLPGVKFIFLDEKEPEDCIVKFHIQPNKRASGPRILEIHLRGNLEKKSGIFYIKDQDKRDFTMNSVVSVYAPVLKMCFPELFA